MPSVSSDDSFSDNEQLENYSGSADVSESESSHSNIPHWHYRNKGCFSSSGSSSPDSSEVFPNMLPAIAGKHIDISPKYKEKQDTNVSVAEMQMMKEKFAKLLLGEDMSGGGNGVCTALAISNAITNLSATVFGELWKLEPLAPQKKALWRREMEWLLSVSDAIVELVPSKQKIPGGGTIEVMMTRQRSDLYTNLPVLRQIDAMLLSILNGFANSEFYYVDRGKVLSSYDESEKCVVYLSSTMPLVRQKEKWWLPFPQVPPNGLSDDVRRRLQHCRECTNQIFKAAIAINSSVLAEMEIPDAYLKSLPKSGKSCLREDIYHYITANQFFPESLIDDLDLSSEHTTLDTINRIETSAYIWRLKYLKRRSSGGKGKNYSQNSEKNRTRAQRADALLKELRRWFPRLPQTNLDTSKIQYNKDVGQAILESYSRVMESLAFNTMARIDEILNVDDATRKKTALDSSFYNDRRR